MSGRINLGDLKSQITKRVGPDRAQRYFSYLGRYLSQKLSKPEFSKLCNLTLGRENLPLHNLLIRSVLKNACQAKVPPPSFVEKSGAKLSPLPATSSNGDVLPISPKRGRTAVRKIKDRPSPLGPNGNQSSIPYGEGFFRENGDLGLCDLKRPLPPHEEHGVAEQPAKRARGLVQVFDVDGERDDVEQRNDLAVSAKVPLRAPLGIPFCPPSVGGARRPLTLAVNASVGNISSSFESGELCHTEDLRRRMERIAEVHGLSGGVAVDCANLLNNGLDVYLKQLIKSSTELVGARSGQGQIKQPSLKQQSHGKPINGVWPGNHMHVQNGPLPSDGVHEPMNSHSISLQDFRVAMELNPQQLGEDWPLLLEKITIRSFEE